jgi:ATP-dependent Clp protease protease subunit
MITIKVYNDIVTGDEAFFMEMFGAENTFSLEKVKDIFADNPKETDFKFDIHCNGGYVSEGLAIYDFLRTSGKNIHCNIDGTCHSMANVILLAAPFENRTANPHAKALIHKVRGGCYGVTVEEIEQYKQSIAADEKEIIKIYSDRTGKSEKAMEVLMSAEKERTATELLKLGFISKINVFNTNFKNLKQMKTNKSKNVFQRAANFVTKTTNKFFKSANFDYTDVEGNVVFSTESEEDTLAVGDVVTLPEGETDGTFELEDGRTVTIVDSVVTEIAEADDETENLRDENAELRQSLQEAVNLIEELKAAKTSNYKPAARTSKGNANSQSAVKSKLDALKNAKK